MSTGDWVNFQCPLGHYYVVLPSNGDHVCPHCAASMIQSWQRGQQPSGGDIESGGGVSERAVALGIAIGTYFSDYEINTSFSFDFLQMDYDDVQGRTRSEKARNIALLIERKGRLEEAIKLFHKLRPKANVSF